MDQAGERALCPDAFFIFEDGDRPAGANRRGFFLEADRSSMTRAGQTMVGRMLEKYARYRDYIGGNLHAKKYGIQSVRVVTIAETVGRAKSLCSLVAETVPRKLQKFFYFASMDDVSLAEPQKILDAIFIHPHDYAEGKRHHLMPPFTDASAEG